MRRGLGSGVFFIFGCKYLNYTLNPIQIYKFIYIVHKIIYLLQLLLYILYNANNIINAETGGKVGWLFVHELPECSVYYGCSSLFIAVNFMAVYGERIHR